MMNHNTYQHGGNPAKDLARLNLPEKHILDFSVNLNPAGIPSAIKDNWADFINSIENYPSVEGDGIVHYYQEKFHISSQNVLAGNGSTEMIYLLPRVLGLKHVLVITPSYHDYERASTLAGSKVSRFPLLIDKGFCSVNLNQLSESLEKVDALWLGRPNNPTGTLFPKELIIDLADRFPEKWFIIDEAFIQFVEGWEEESFINKEMRANIVVIHSLTKIYALAGIRMGGVIGNGDLISRLKERKEPWSVNGIADRIAPLLLHCANYEQQSRQHISSERNKVYQYLEEMEGFIPFSSTTDFLLCQWVRTRNLDDLIQHLLFNGAYVRDCRNFPGLKENFFRIGLRSSDENSQLLSILSSFPDDPV